MPIFDDEDSLKSKVGTKKEIDGITYIKFLEPNLWAQVIETEKELSELVI
jgi:hypothetical protein